MWRVLEDLPDTGGSEGEPQTDPHEIHRAPTPGSGLRELGLSAAALSISHGFIGEHMFAKLKPWTGCGIL